MTEMILSNGAPTRRPTLEDELGRIADVMDRLSSLAAQAEVLCVRLAGRKPEPSKLASIVEIEIDIEIDIKEKLPLIDRTAKQCDELAHEVQRLENALAFIGAAIG
jgi:hypothetical protein